MNHAPVGMSQYISHKKVWAAEIEMISVGKDQGSITFKDYQTIYYISQELEKMLARYKPVAGDFLVIYADGYQSFSPRKAFLEGYTRETQIHPSGSQT